MARATGPFVTGPRRAASAMVVALVAVVTSCGDGDHATADDAGRADGGAAPDGGLGEGALDAGVRVEPPLPPTPPALPAIAPCPDGWTEVDSSIEGARVCDPWPATGREDTCALGDAHFPGESGCAPVGAPCASDDDWAHDLPTDRRVVYVRPGATGGDGTRTRPYGTLARGLQSARGSVVALAKGTYELTDPATVDGHAVWGACPAETVVVSARAAYDMTAFLLAGDGAEVRGLTIRGPGLGIVALAGIDLVVESVVIDSPGFAGIWARGDQADVAMSIRSVVVRDVGTLPDAESSDGTCLFASFGAQVTVERARFDRCVGYAVFAGSDAVVDLSRGAVTRVAEDVDASAFAIAASHDATVHVRDSSIEMELPSRGDEAVHAAIFAELGASIDVRTSRVQGGGSAAIASAAGRVGLARTSLRGLANEAFVALHEGSEIAIADVVAEGGVLDAPSNAGGVRVQRGATATLARVAMRDVEGFGVLALGVEPDGDPDLPPTTVTIEDLVLRDLTSVDPAFGTYGAGVTSAYASRVAMRRVDIERATGIGVSAELGGAMEIEDLAVRDTRPAVAQDGVGELGGFGLSVQSAGSLTVRRVRVERSSSAAVVAVESGATLIAEDLDVSETLGFPASRRFGVGVLVLDDGTSPRAGPLRATLRRTRIAGSRDVGLFVQGRELPDVEVAVEASDLEVIDTDVAACRPECDEPASGTAVVVNVGASLEVERFRITRAAYAGVLFDAVSRLRLAHGAIGAATIGLLYDGSSALDPATVLEDVVLRDNVEDVVSRDVVVPDPPGSIDGD